MAERSAVAVRAEEASQVIAMITSPYSCIWAGHLLLPGGGVWGQQQCLRCGVIRRIIGPLDEYIRVRVLS